MNILNRLTGAGFFRPKSVEQFFALQIARKLTDQENLSTYLRWAEQLDRRRLIDVFRRTQERSDRTTNPAETFEREVTSTNHTSFHA